MLFFIKEFQRLTDRIDILTKARDALTEYLHEIEDQNTETVFIYSSVLNDVSSLNGQLQYSPPERSPQQHKLSVSSIQANSKDIGISDFPIANGQQTSCHNYSLSSPLSSPLSTHSLSQPVNYSNQRSRSPSMISNTFIRVHFPNKHTTAVS